MESNSERPLSRLFCPKPDPWDLLRKNEKMEEELAKKEEELGSKTNDMRRKDRELRRLVEELRRTNEALVVKSDQLGRKNEELGKMKENLHFYEEENIELKMKNTMLQKEIVRNRRKQVKKLKLRRQDKATEEQFNALYNQLLDVTNHRWRLMRIVRRYRAAARQAVHGP